MLYVHCSCLEAVILLDVKIPEKLSILSGMQSELQENGTIIHNVFPIPQSQSPGLKIKITLGSPFGNQLEK